MKPDERETALAVFVKESTDTADRQEKLLERVQDARQAMDFAVKTWKKDWAEWTDQSKTALEDMRTWRMAIDGEAHKLTAGLADIRKFFLSLDHTAEVERLREFIDLCERLQKLKQSGFLDQVADTILKLEKA